MSSEEHVEGDGWSVLAVAIGGAVCVAAAWPSLASPWAALDWTDTVERAMVGLLEALVIFAWALRGGSVSAAPTAAHRWIGWGIAGWFLASLASLLTASHWAMAVVRTAEWLLHVAFGLVVWSEVSQRPRSATLWRWGALGGVALVAAAMLRWWARLDNPLGDVGFGLPFVHGPRVVGMVGLAAAVLGLTPATGKPRWGPAIAWSALGWGCIWWSGARASVGAVVVGLVALGVMRVLPFRIVLASAAGCAIGALASIPLYVPSLGMGISRFWVAVAGAGEFTSGRGDLWATVFDAWRESPWLGLGPDGVFAILSPVGIAHAHSTVVQAFGEWGIVGAVPFLGVLAGLLLVGLAAGRAAQSGPNVHAGATAYVAASLANGLLDGVLYDPALTLLFASAAAVALARPLAWRQPQAAAGPLAGSRGRLVLLVPALLATAVCVLHLATLRAVGAPGTPAIASARVRLVQAFPSVPVLQPVVWWVADWARDSPEAALALGSWGVAQQRHPWAFRNARATVFAAQGCGPCAAAEQARAIAEQRHAMRRAPPWLTRP